MNAATRTLALATNALICGTLAGLVALYTLGRSLPPSDGAYGISVWDSLKDPFVFAVWLPLVLIGAAVGFVFSLWLLWRVDLSKAIPTVAVTTVVAAAASAPIFAPLSPLVGLSAGVAAMLWCRRRAG